MSHFALNTSTVCLVFVHRTESLVAEPRLTDSPCDQPYIRDEEILDSIRLMF